MREGLEPETVRVTRVWRERSEGTERIAVRVVVGDERAEWCAEGPTVELAVGAAVRAREVHLHAVRDGLPF